jgi:hypothetical protein
VQGMIFKNNKTRMIFLYLIIALTYMFNAHLIYNYTKDSGVFAVIDLVHLIFSPLTIFNVVVLKGLSYVLPLDYPLWSRNDD